MVISAANLTCVRKSRFLMMHQVERLCELSLYFVVHLFSMCQIQKFFFLHLGG